MNVSIGIDIGGTKCALSLGACTADAVTILHREEFPTAGKPWRDVLEAFAVRLERILGASPGWTPVNLGISCGGRHDFG